MKPSSSTKIAAHPGLRALASGPPPHCAVCEPDANESEFPFRGPPSAPPRDRSWLGCDLAQHGYAIAEEGVVAMGCALRFADDRLVFDAVANLPRCVAAAEPVVQRAFAGAPAASQPAILSLRLSCRLNIHWIGLSCVRGVCLDRCFFIRSGAIAARRRGVMNTCSKARATRLIVSHLRVAP